MPFDLVKNVLQSEEFDQPVEVAGWIRSIRNNKSFSFVVLNDGSTQDDIQVIVDANLDNYDEVSKLIAGSAISVKGKLVKSEGKNQSIEVHAQLVNLFGKVDESYPLQKKGTSLEFLREQGHLRPRTNLFGAIFRIRHALAFATHKFFNDQGFYYINTPIITGIDAEGAGEMFNVTTFDLNNPPRKDGKIDYSKDYFAKDTSLTVSGQLEAECFALGLRSVYTFGPTFRSENSNTARHLAEFWMIEPEVAFADLEDVAKLGSDFIKYLISYALKHCRKELDFISKWKKWNKEQDGDHIKTLEHVRDSDFVKVTYTEAIEILKNTNKKFEYDANWGDDLQTEHERYLTEEHFKSPVIVTDYPRDIKAFYMKQSEDGKTVRAMDILVPGVGEIIGGSQREDCLEKLTKRCEEMGMNKDALWWYLDLRRYGSVPHAGFGLGFERAIMYVTGMKNIRDVIPFPRTPRSAEF